MENNTSIEGSSRWSFGTAMILAVAADAVQIFGAPMFAEGALSPFDDLLDLGVAAILLRLLGWHWEFLPAFAGELIPGVDLVPLWTLAVMSVYRKSRQTVPAETEKEQPREEPPFIEGEYKSL